MGAPFVATEDKARDGIIAQLNLRSEDDLLAWQEQPKEISKLAKTIAMALEREMIWPSHHFLPADPVDIVFALHFDLAMDDWSMKPVAQIIVENQLGIKMDSEFWFELKSMTYLEAITRIEMKRADAAADSPNGL